MLKSLVKNIIHYFQKNIKKSHLIIFGTGLFLIFVGFLSWNFYFSKIYIFEQNEKIFQKAVEDYYRENPIFLPKDDMIRTMTLEDLYEKARIDTLTAPKSQKLCNTDSWVKVYNNHGEYEYYVYLDCGKYYSKVDHEGPEITLNGESTVYVSLGREYQELGVSKVYDKKDGEIDVSKVTIESQNVNTKKVGTYEVTYTVRDLLNNQTKVKRTVVVARNLTDTVIDQTDDSNYYKGRIVDNNYVLFSGMMFRIIGVKEDGTVLVISDELLNNLRINSNEYENSNIDQFLTNSFLPKLNSQDEIVESDYCTGEISSYEDISNSCSKTVKRKVAVLSVDELQKTFLDGGSFLCTNLSYSLTNYLGGNNVNTNASMDYCLEAIDGVDFRIPSIRPVITLKKDMSILSGNGTKQNPYKLNDYSYGKTQDEIKTRLVGEYVNYSGMIFRIMDQTDGNTRLISIHAFQKNVSETSSSDILTFELPENENEYYRFNVKNENNPGYLLNNDYLDYINSKSIITSEYDIPLNEPGKIYSNYQVEKIKAKVVIPKTYDLFSSVHSSNSGALYLYLDSSPNKDSAFYINVMNGRVFDDYTNAYGPYNIKPVITVSGNLKIKSGNGTINNPYYIG